MTYFDIFPKGKAVIAMLHLKGVCLEDRMDRAKWEIEIYYRNGVDAVLVENYYGSESDCEWVLEYLQKSYPEKIYGVNILGNAPLAFELAERYGAKFVQLDSVSGHLAPSQEKTFEKKLTDLRSSGKVLVFGGVRFKYQPVLSGRTVEEDLEIGKQRCDAIVVTGKSMGKYGETPEEKILQFRDALGDFPLVTGAGITLDNVRHTLSLCDGVIVGSWFKQRHRADGEVKEKYVRQIMADARMERP